MAFMSKYTVKKEVTLSNEVHLLTLVNVVADMNLQYICYSIY